jgi:SAM-dependent methyltransferase
MLACPGCSSVQRKRGPAVITDALAAQWGLSGEERELIDARETTRCGRCGLSLRSMSLAAAIKSAFGFKGPLAAWLPALAPRKLLEVNGAGDLQRYLRVLPRRTTTSYPAVDIQALPFADGSFSLVVHSETLEHVDDPVRALAECRRVLNRRGTLAYTVPVIPGRMTRRRDGLEPSYHGLPGSNDYLVKTEYGADFWMQPLEAGFREVRLVSLGTPELVAVVARG